MTIVGIATLGARSRNQQLEQQNAKREFPGHDQPPHENEPNRKSNDDLI
jgi:hypothetical protein